MSTRYYTCRDGDSVKTVWVQQLVAPALQFALCASSGIGHESVKGDLATAECVITHCGCGWVREESESRRQCTSPQSR
jgi:hypothetical protein